MKDETIKQYVGDCNCSVPTSTLTPIIIIPDQVVQFMGLLFGEEVALALPHPGVDMEGFMQSIQLQLESTTPAFNIVTKKVEPLIHLGKLKSHLRRQMGGGGGCVIL